MNPPPKTQLTTCEAAAIVRHAYKSLSANPRTLALDFDRAVVDICPELWAIAHRRGSTRPRVTRILAEAIEDDKGEIYWKGTVYDLDGSEVAFRMRDHRPEDSDYYNSFWPEVVCEFWFTGSATP
jgi:hypothetical protein